MTAELAVAAETYRAAWLVALQDAARLRVQVAALEQRLSQVQALAVAAEREAAE